MESAGVGWKVGEGRKEGRKKERNELERERGRGVVVVREEDEDSTKAGLSLFRGKEQQRATGQQKPPNRSLFLRISFSLSSLLSVDSEKAGRGTGREEEQGQKEEERSKSNGAPSLLFRSAASFPISMRIKKKKGGRFPLQDRVLFDCNPRRWGG